ncbi:MAG: hypothetical protein Q8K62_00390 [Thiobacillus sp.]|nr:hypothetical protein [Thiobacillus sp.]
MAAKHYLGKAGHLAVMSELAFRGYNVATPEIDIGDDVFAVNDDTGALYRVQVKTATATIQRKSKRCQFSLRLDQIRRPQTPELHYVFASRFNDRWNYVVISRAVLEHLQAGGLGSVAAGANGRQTVTIGITFFDDGTVMGGKENDLKRYLNNWDTWPIL